MLSCILTIVSYICDQFVLYVLELIRQYFQNRGGE